MKHVFALTLALLCCSLCGMAVMDEASNPLVQCVYIITGGMENENRIMTLDAQGLTISVHDMETHYDTTWDTLRDLEAYIAQYAPETWAELPYMEEFLLDAPDEALRVVYADGSAYTIRQTKVQPTGSGSLMRDVYTFMRSYTVENAHTFTLEINSTDGIEMQETPTLADPELLFVRSVKDYGPGHDDFTTGASYTQTYEYHGRIPGATELTINGFGTGEPVPVWDGNEKRWKYQVYTLTVDRDFNVTCDESWRWVEDQS